MSGIVRLRLPGDAQMNRRTPFATRRPHRAGRAGRRVAALAAAGLAVGLTQVPASAAALRAGASGVGDSYFPLAGNGGYGVDHYDLDLAYAPDGGHLDGFATLHATATARLDRFDLDLEGLTVSSVTVNGLPATYDRAGQELVVTPARALDKGQSFVVAVRYGGTPGPITDPDGSIEGWVPTDDGAYVVGEPNGSMTWFPANNHPTDKASFTFRITVPAGTTAVANGALVSRTVRGGSTTFVWDEAEPMAAYLATATLGHFDVSAGRTAQGLASYVAVDPRAAAAAAPALARIDDIVDYFSTVFGPYPFSSVGAVVDIAPDVGYALETQTRPVFPEAPDTTSVARGLAHQWFGDSVSVADWSDIWLSEGFSTYAEWLWAEHEGQGSAQQAFDDLYATPADDAELWDPPPADPAGPENLFAESVSVRGAMALQALRTAVGDADFFEILHRWTATYRYATATTKDFVDLARRVAHRPVQDLLRDWLYGSGKPAAPTGS